MKLHLFAAAAAALLCAAPIISADADVLELNNLDFEEQQDSLLLDNFISESEGSEIRVRSGKAEGPSPSTRRPSRPNTRRPTRTRRPTGKRPTRRPSRTRRPTRRPTGKRPTRRPSRTRRPTRRPTRRNTRRPTRRPNRAPSSDRRTIRQLMNHPWRLDQCVPRRRGMSFICEELDCHICAQGRRNINRRMENICERVGLPFRNQRNRCGNDRRRVREAEEEIMAYAAEESDSMKSEDMDTESEDTEFANAAKASKAPRSRSGKTGKSTRRGISMSISRSGKGDKIRSGKSGKGDKMAVVFASE